MKYRIRWDGLGYHRLEYKTWYGWANLLSHPTQKGCPDVRFTTVEEARRALEKYVLSTLRVEIRDR